MTQSGGISAKNELSKPFSARRELSNDIKIVRIRGATHSKLYPKNYPEVGVV